MVVSKKVLKESTIKKSDQIFHFLQNKKKRKKSEKTIILFQIVFYVVKNRVWEKQKPRNMESRLTGCSRDNSN